MIQTGAFGLGLGYLSDSYSPTSERIADNPARCRTTSGGDLNRTFAATAQALARNQLMRYFEAITSGFTMPKSDPASRQAWSHLSSRFWP